MIAALELASFEVQHVQLVAIYEHEHDCCRKSHSELDVLVGMRMNMCSMRAFLFRTPGMALSRFFLDDRGLDGRDIHQA